MLQLAAQRHNFVVFDRFMRIMARPAGLRKKGFELALPTDTTGGGPASPAAASHGLSNAFARAERHSNRVRLLKIALPVLGVVMAAAFFGYSYVVTPASISVTAEGAAYSDGKLVMANPKLDGFTNGDRPYNMTADRAIQDLASESVIELEGIDATLPVDADNWATVIAPKGTYDRTMNTLDITDGMTIKTADGMLATLKSARLDIEKGDMTTNDPVDIQLQGAKITSDSMTILENGKVMIFEKRVRMNIDPQRLKTAQQASGDQNVVQ